MRTETKCLHEGYKPGKGEPRQIPICQSTTFKYDSSEEMGKLFDLEASGYFTPVCKTPAMIWLPERLRLWKAVLRRC